MTELQAIAHELAPFRLAQNMLGNGTTRRVGPELVLEQIDPDRIVLWHLVTVYVDLLTFHRDGRVIVKTSGTRDGYTRKLIDRFCLLDDVSVQRSGDGWRVRNNRTGRIVPFADGMDLGSV